MPRWGQIYHGQAPVPKANPQLGVDPVTFGVRPSVLQAICHTPQIALSLGGTDSLWCNEPANPTHCSKNYTLSMLLPAGHTLRPFTVPAERGKCCDQASLVATGRQYSTCPSRHAHPFHTYVAFAVPVALCRSPVKISVTLPLY